MKPRAKSQKPRALKLASRVLVLLLLGAVVNVGVAWGSAMRTRRQLRPPQVEQHELDDYESDYYGDLYLRWDHPTATQIILVKGGASPSGPGSALKIEDQLPGWAVDELARLESEVSDDCQIAYWHSPRTVEGRGWPMTVFVGGVLRRTWYRRDQYPDCGFRTLHAVPLVPKAGGFDPWNPVPSQFLPLRPLFPGFLINTLFYAVVLWLLLFAPFAARRMIRRRRGRCPQCGYSLEGLTSDKCPECGKERPA